MAARNILKMGDPRLLQRAVEVKSFGTPWLRELLADMFDTMHAAGGVGLAAPQIGESARVVIFGFEQSERYPEAPAVPRTILVNPVIMPLGGEEEDGWEGCLSVPGLRGLVPRFRRLRYLGFDPDGVSIDRTVEGFHARVVQHEVDHLDGILYPMRIRDMSRFGFQEVLFPGHPAGDD
ncbi:MAG TPA: peptide deformylase [Steroidobacteraceae bacterium]|nr:peptide deformylase [Steroidobacteraceae bacterium]